jgi:hypothetical protein
MAANRTSGGAAPPARARTPSTRARGRAGRRGQALVEFALIAFAFYLLLSGTLELGRMLFVSHLVQGAARAGARELAIIPLPATASFAEALEDPRVRERVYDPARLVLDVTGLDAAGVQDAIDALPTLNRLLAPLMISDPDSLPGRELLRYPGALVQGADGSLRVAIPRVLERGESGVETIDWLEVVEEVVPDDDPAHAPFSLISTGPQQGLVALRVHYPFQAASMAAWRSEESGGQVSNVVLEADDGAVTSGEPPPGALVGGGAGGVYAGVYGLGALQAMGKTVRPFRRLLSSQSVFRREVFSQ